MPTRGWSRTAASRPPLIARALGAMIFVAETEERSLYTFPTEAEAIANCEGIDVEAGIWLFWNDSGQPLEPKFTIPNKRGSFTVTNGVYALVSATSTHRVPLAGALKDIIHYRSAAPFNSEADVRTYLAHRYGA